MYDGFVNEVLLVNFLVSCHRYVVWGERDNLKDKYHHPDNRETIFYKEHPPNTVVQSPSINTQLIEDINKKDSDVVYLMNTAQKFKEEDWIYVYTDVQYLKELWMLVLDLE